MRMLLSPHSILTYNTDEAKHQAAKIPIFLNHFHQARPTFTSVGWLILKTAESGPLRILDRVGRESGTREYALVKQITRGSVPAVEQNCRVFITHKQLWTMRLALTKHNHLGQAISVDNSFRPQRTRSNNNVSNKMNDAAFSACVFIVLPCSNSVESDGYCTVCHNSKSSSLVRTDLVILSNTSSHVTTVASRHCGRRANRRCLFLVAILCLYVCLYCGSRTISENEQLKFNATARSSKLL